MALEGSNTRLRGLPMRWLIAAIAALSIFASRSDAAVEVFLRIPGVPGESLDEAHRGWMEAATMSFSTEKVPATQREYAYTKANAMRFTRMMDSASPHLMESMANGGKITEVEVHFVRSGQQGVVFYRLLLRGVYITAVELMMDAEGQREEVLEIKFQEMNWCYVELARDYFKLRKDGFDWDIANNLITGMESESLFMVTGISGLEGDTMNIQFVPQRGITYRLMVANQASGPYTERLRLTVSEDTPEKNISLPKDLGNKFYFLEALLQ